VDFLPLAQPAAVEFLPFSVRPDLSNNFVFGVTLTFPEGEPTLRRSSTTKRIITRIIVPFSFFSPSSYPSILLIRS
jgi:hypothetical protein